MRYKSMCDLVTPFLSLLINMFYLNDDFIESRNPCHHHPLAYTSTDLALAVVPSPLSPTR